MKSAICAAALLLALGTTAVYAQQDRSQDNHQTEHQQGKPENKGAKPAPSHGKPARQQTGHAARPQQQAAHSQGRPARPQQHAARPQEHATHTPRSVHAGARPAHSSSHGRISNSHYAASFGSRHRFHINRDDYQRRRFTYGGYSFGFVDPWPSAWAYSDPVYVVYLDGGYYMYDPLHPGIRITLNIF